MGAATPPLMRGRGGPRAVVPVEEPYRINERIRVPEVRLIVEGEDGEDENVGVMATFEALRMARERELDLVEVAPQAQPPVCKIMDYGRFKYLMERKQREAHRAGKAGRAASDMKDVQLSPRIDEHDMAVKIDRAHRFLQEGHPVRMVVRFLGRDMRHPEVGRAALDTALQALGQLIPIAVDVAPRMEGRQMTALVRLAKGAKVDKERGERPGRAVASANGAESADGAVSPDQVVVPAEAPAAVAADGAAAREPAGVGAPVPAAAS
jgi:translation initiation factor IF-3